MPKKFGLKFWALIEVENKSIVNILPYLGIQDKMQSKEVLSVSMWLTSNPKVEIALCEMTVIFWLRATKISTSNATMCHFIFIHGGDLSGAGLCKVESPVLNENSQVLDRWYCSQRG